MNELKPVAETIQLHNFVYTVDAVAALGPRMVTVSEHEKPVRDIDVPRMSGRQAWLDWSLQWPEAATDADPALLVLPRMRLIVKHNATASEHAEYDVWPGGRLPVAAGNLRITLRADAEEYEFSDENEPQPIHPVLVVRVLPGVGAYQRWTNLAQHGVIVGGDSGLSDPWESTLRIWPHTRNVKVYCGADVTELSIAFGRGHEVTGSFVVPLDTFVDVPVPADAAWVTHRVPAEEGNVTVHYWRQQ